MENEMMNNMDAMTENLTDAMPEVDNLVPSVDENHAEVEMDSLFKLTITAIYFIILLTYFNKMLTV